MKKLFAGAVVAILAMAVWAIPSNASVLGKYVEVRSADVYTGPCFANSEVGLEGRQAILAWKINQGEWQGANISGLSVVAVVSAKDNLGDPYHNPYPAKAILIVDQHANAAQQRALVSFVTSAGGRLLTHVVRVDRAPISIVFGEGANHGVVTVVAGNLARIQTRSLCAGDDICGNEIRYYPPLTKVSGAMPAYTVEEAYDGKGLGVVWNRRDDRSAYIASFHM
ncbi:MAG: DUF1326 domain-containing protein [Acidobacteriota bacterium]|nr:DUF1326 domain-containing protein [Acidobacteriota bacterium]